VNIRFGTKHSFKKHHITTEVLYLYHHLYASMSSLQQEYGTSFTKSTRELKSHQLRFPPSNAVGRIVFCK